MDNICRRHFQIRFGMLRVVHLKLSTALVQIKASHWTDGDPLVVLTMPFLLMQKYVTRPRSIQKQRYLHVVAWCSVCSSLRIMVPLEAYELKPGSVHFFWFEIYLYSMCSDKFAVKLYMQIPPMLARHQIANPFTVAIRRIAFSSGKQYINITFIWWIFSGLFREIDGMWKF